MNSRIVDAILLHCFVAITVVPIIAFSDDPPTPPKDPFYPATPEEEKALQKRLQEESKRRRENPEYPIDFLLKELPGALGNEWVVTSTPSTITIRSRFKIEGYGRIGTLIPREEEERAKLAAPYEIKLTFTPALGNKDLQRLRDAKRDVISKLKAGTRTKDEYSDLQDQFDAIRIPVFCAIDYYRSWNVIGSRWSSGWMAYMDTSDHPLGFFRPMSTYQKCKAAEAIVSTYFSPIDPFGE